MKRILLLLILAASLASCAVPAAGPATSAPATVTPTPGPAPSETATAAPVIPPTETPVTPSPAASPTEVVPPSPAASPPLAPLPLPTLGGINMTPTLQTLVDQARTDLAARLGVAAAAITVVTTQEVEWPDTGLGCGKPGMMYAQVITPGYRIVLEASGKQYEYHASRTNVVYCEK